MALPSRPLRNNSARAPLKTLDSNGKGSPGRRLASPAKKRLGHALAYGSGKASAIDAEPAADAKVAATAGMPPEEAADLARKLCADIMSRTKIPAEAEARLNTAKTVMIELCAGLMARGAIGVEVATRGCSIEGELLPHVESFMGWVQSGFLDSITIADHGALLRAKCGEVNREIDTLLKGGEVRKFVSAMRPKDEQAPEDAVNAAKNRVQAHQSGKSPAKARRRPSSKGSPRGISQSRANSAPPTTEVPPARTCSNGSDVATKPRVVTSRPKVWAPSNPSENLKRKNLTPAPPSNGRARSVRGGRRPATAGHVVTDTASAPPKSTASMGQAVENALKTARAGEKRRRQQIKRELSAEAAAKSGRTEGQQPEPLFESWKEKGKIFAAASDSFRRNTEATMAKIAKKKNKHRGVDDLKAEMAKLKGPGPTRPPSSRATSRAGNNRKTTAVPAVNSRRPRDAYDEFVAAFQKQRQDKEAKAEIESTEVGAADTCTADEAVAVAASEQPEADSEADCAPAAE